MESREDMNNVGPTDVKDDLVLVNGNNHHEEQEIQNDKNAIPDEDLSQGMMNSTNHTSCNSQRGWKEKFSIFICYAAQRLKCICQEIKMKMKIFPFEILKKFKYQSAQKPKQIMVPSPTLLSEETAPERELTDQQIVPSSREREPSNPEVALTSSEKEPTDRKIVPSLPTGEPNDKEILSFSPKRKPTNQEIGPSSNKNGLMDRKAIIFNMILMMLVVLAPVSSTTNGIIIFPSKTVVIPGDNIAFLCADPSHTALSVKWLVNGTLLENSRLEIVFQRFDNISKTANLHFGLTLDHNVTTIQCIGNFASENVSSETITLLLQGLLSAVRSSSVDLVGTNISLTWTAPFTLDISNVDPDITYCVDVVNSTSSSIVLSECGITVTGFNFSIPNGRVCDNYTFTVTPVNGVGNGTAVTLGYSQYYTVPRASKILLLPTSETTYQITMSAPVCYGELTVINDNTGDETHIQGSDLNITTHNITFISEKLKKDQLYTISVNASNINGSAVSYVSLSTHDVMNATFDVTSQTITTEYFEYSTAMGALYIFIFINEDRSIDFKKSIYLPLDRSSSHNYTLPDISPGQYQMFVYDIDRDVTLHDSVNYPANTNMFSIISDGPQASYSRSTFSELQECSVTYVDDVISAMCSYSGDSSVTGFQIAVQLKNVTGVHKLHINCTTEHQSTGPVTIQVYEYGTYHVVIFPVMGDRGIVDTTIAYSQLLSVTVSHTMMPEISMESSQGWKTAVGVVVPLVLIIIGIIAGIGIGYRNSFSMMLLK